MNSCIGIAQPHIHQVKSVTFGTQLALIQDYKPRSAAVRRPSRPIND
jgi:hypothetical protein